MAVMHQPYLRAAWLISDCFRQSLTQACGLPGGHPHLGIIQRSCKYSSSFLNTVYSLRLSLTSLNSVKRMSTQSSQVSWFLLGRKEVPNASWLLLLTQTWSLLSGINPGWKDLLLFILPILFCKQRSLTHHCDSCLHCRLFWAEVTQDTMWLHPNLATHSMPELNHLCVLCK